MYLGRCITHCYKLLRCLWLADLSLNVVILQWIYKGSVKYNCCSYPSREWGIFFHLSSAHLLQSTWHLQDHSLWSWWSHLHWQGTDLGGDELKIGLISPHILSHFTPLCIFVDRWKSTKAGNCWTQDNIWTRWLVSLTLNLVPKTNIKLLKHSFSMENELSWAWDNSLHSQRMLYQLSFWGSSVITHTLCISVYLYTMPHMCMWYSIYMEAVKDHVITNAAGGKTVCLKKSNLPDTGKDSAFPSV